LTTANSAIAFDLPVKQAVRMNDTSETSKTATVNPLPDWERLVTVIGHKRRWKIMKELSAGEPRTIAELAAVAGCGYDNASKHLALMRRAGLVVLGRGHLYQIPKQYLPTPGQPVVDFGHCLLRLDAAG
jgi:predicted transcriptional regulator